MKTMWKKVLNILLKNIIYAYYFILLKTIRFHFKGKDAVEKEQANGKSSIILTPHSTLISTLLVLESLKSTILTSKSKDGEIIAQTMARRGVEIVRGSSNRGGIAALRQLAEHIKQGRAIGIAYDGPKGPEFVPKKGFLGCARQTQGSVFVLWTRILKKKKKFGMTPFRLRTWDRLVIFTPFSELEMEFEKLPQQKDLNLNQEEYEEYLIKIITEKATYRDNVLFEEGV